MEAIETGELNLQTKFPDLVGQVRRFGNSCSDAILDPLSEIFRTDSAEGLIGYRLVSSSAIVYGDPLCPWEEVPKLVKAFHAYCKKNKIKNIIYIATSEEFARWALKNQFAGAFIEFGRELFLDPHDDPKAKTGGHACLVRRKVQHALKENVSVVEYVPSNLDLEKEMEEVGEKWLRSRKGRQIHISHVHLFRNRPGKRWFYARRGNTIIGVIVLNQLQSKGGWLINHIMHVPDASHGTPEILLTTALDVLAKEGCNYVTFGAVTTGALGEMAGLGPLTDWAARLSFQAINKFFRLDGKIKFWEKFDPEGKPSYLVFANSQIGLRSIWALMRGLNVIS
jgi:lysylphosphatidylglycerol synthetase-like protein (DUF2156 family)